MWKSRVVVLVLCCLAAAALPVRTQDLNDYNQFDNPVVLPLLTQLLYSKVSNLTTSLGYEINNRSSFCIRESASGVGSLAYFLAKYTIDHFNTVIKPVVYLSMFYASTNPRSTFTDNYVVLQCLVYCVAGIAYALAIFFEAGAAQLWSVLLRHLNSHSNHRSNGSSISKIIADFTFPKWALQAFVIANAERFDGVWLITR